MTIFIENTEDIYAGIEWQKGSPEAKKVIDFLQDEMGVENIRFPETSGIGVKPISEEGTKRLVRPSIDYAITEGRKDRKSTRLNSSHVAISYAVFCLKIESTLQVGTSEDS